jgi:hypothetical protein
MDPEGPATEQALFTKEELTRIYREEAAAATATGNRLTVLLVPYGLPGRSSSRHRDD